MFVRFYVPSKTRGHEHISPILLCILNSSEQTINCAFGQLQNGEAYPFKLNCGVVLTAGQVPTTVHDQIRYGIRT